MREHLKTVGAKALGGSNPSLSASFLPDSERWGRALSRPGAARVHPRRHVIGAHLQRGGPTHREAARGVRDGGAVNPSLSAPESLSSDPSRGEVAEWLKALPC